MQLIENWSDAWRFYSTQALAAIAILNSVALAFDAIKPVLPPEWVAGGSLGLALLGAVLRVVAQGPKP